MDTYIETTKAPSDRRSSIRSLSNPFFPIELRYNVKNLQTNIPSFCANFSPDGLGVICPETIPVGTSVTAIFKNNSQEKSLVLNGTVQWRIHPNNPTSTDEFHIGIKFSGTIQSDSEQLKKIIAESSQDPHIENIEEEKIVRIPHNSHHDYNDDFIEQRRQWLSNISNKKFQHISKYSIHPQDVKGNIENFIGVAQVPLGLVGPIKINGDHAKGVFYVPLATTEGALITTYQRGAIAITKSGGVRTRIIRDSNCLDPVFILKNGDEAARLVQWVNAYYSMLCENVINVTNHGKLLEIVPIVIGRRVILKISYSTEDAMGANMINIATESICKFIRQQFQIEKYILRSNFSSEKKAAGVNLTSNYGKEVHVEAIIPKRIVKLYLHTSAEEIAEAWHSWSLGSMNAGVLGMSAQIANGISGIYIACGQDVAHVSNASVGIIMFECVNDGDLYAALKLPNIIVGTVGGGTALGTQRECLEMIGCYGQGKAKKFAEIVAAVILAGEVGICAGLTSDEFLSPHIKASVHTRKKAYENSPN